MPDPAALNANAPAMAIAAKSRNDRNWPENPESGSDGTFAEPGESLARERNFILQFVYSKKRTVSKSLQFLNISSSRPGKSSHLRNKLVAIKHPKPKTSDIAGLNTIGRRRLASA